MRKILIVPFGKIVDYEQSAVENDISEIADGIPPALIDLYKEEDLPVIHTEEPTPEPQPTEIELLKEQVNAQQTIIDDLLFNIIPTMTGDGL